MNNKEKKISSVRSDCCHHEKKNLLPEIISFRGKFDHPLVDLCSELFIIIIATFMSIITEFQDAIGFLVDVIDRSYFLGNNSVYTIRSQTHRQHWLFLFFFSLAPVIRFFSFNQKFDKFLI